jgi:hypothetical protein
MDEETMGRHSVNCYFCGDLVDERQCQPADDYNGEDGGSICQLCLRSKWIEGYIEGARTKPYDEGSLMSHRDDVFYLAARSIAADLSDRLGFDEIANRLPTSTRAGIIDDWSDIISRCIKEDAMKKESSDVTG